jgi:hypothetical protein
MNVWIYQIDVLNPHYFCSLLSLLCRPKETEFYCSIILKKLEKHPTFQNTKGGVLLL